MNELSDVLQHIHDNASALESLLISEAASLKLANSAEQIEAIAIQKMDLVQTLDQLALRRRQLLDESSNAVQHSSAPDWQEILAILSRCQMLNNQTGADIAVQARYKQRALEILSSSAHGGTPLYSAKGAAQYAGPKQALGKA